MRKFLIITLLLLVGSSSVLWAQSKGDVLIGTVIGVNVSKNNVTTDGVKTEGDPSVTWGVGPGVYVFPANKVRLGVQFSLSKMKDRVSDFDHKTGSFSVGPSFSYYFRLADRFYLTPEIGAFFTHAKSTYEHRLTRMTVTEDMNGFGFSLIPAQFEFRPGKRFCMAANMFSLSYSNLEASNATSTDGFVFDIGLNPTVGIGFYF